MAKKPEAKPLGFLEAILRGSEGTKDTGGLPVHMFEPGPSITMKSRLDGELIKAQLDARAMANLYDDPYTRLVADVCAELWVSHDGKGRQEAVEMGRQVYQTNVGTPSGASDPTLEG